MSKKRNEKLRYSENVSLGDMLKIFTKENRLDKKMESIQVEDAFVSSIPASSRKYIVQVKFSNGILNAKVDSASLRQNLHMASSSLCDIINEKLGSTIVHKILLS